MTQLQIAGFTASDKVPGFFGQTLTGQGAVSAQNVPMVVLCTGIMNTTTGAATLNVPVAITSAGSADTYFGAGSQVARQCYAALASQGAIVYGQGIAAAGGAVAAKAVINIAGTWTTSGTFGYRIAGQERYVTVASTDTPQTVAANIVNDINSQFRWPVTATSALLGSTTTYQVTITHKTGGKGGNQQILFIDPSQCPSGFIGSVIASYVGTAPALTWQASTAYATGAMTQPTTANGYFYVATTGGTSGTPTQPTWPTTVGTTVSDGSVTWTCVGAILTGGLVPFFQGSGVESAANALAAIINQQYDRIAPAQNDSTNVALWQTQVDAQAGPTTNILGQVVIATNGTEAAAQTLAQSTLNDVRFQVLNEVNSETHPCEIAASFASARSTREGANWDQGYDSFPVPTVAAQSQSNDSPNHASLVLALNNGVTPIFTLNNVAVICRAITTFSLLGSTPDYSALDTNQITVPDQVRTTIRLFWTTQFVVQCPVVQPDPPTSASGQLGAFPPSGVAMPSTWNAAVYQILKGIEKGNGFPYPQITEVDENLPVTSYSPSQNCLISAIPVVPTPLQHQIGVSVQGTLP